jgi:ERCC4-type nuclease
MAKKDTPKFKGVEIEMAGETYVLPPLPIKAFSKGDATEKIKHIQEEFEQMKDNSFSISQKSVADLVSLVTQALQRNYPGVDENVVEDGLDDITTLFNMFQYLISQSDDMKKKMAEAQKNSLRAFVEQKEAKN